MLDRRNEDNYLLTLIGSLSDAVFSYNQDGTYRFVNESFAVKFGKTPVEIIGKGPDFIFSPEEAKHRLAIIAQVFATGEKKEYSGLITNCHGEIRKYQTVANPIRDKDGNITSVACISKDVTERVLAEEKLRESEKKYRELVESANSIILRVDTSGNIIYFNEFAEKFFGFTRAEIIGQNVVGTILSLNDSLGNNLEEMMSRIVNYPDDYLSNTNENICKDGTVVLVSWSNKAIRDNKGQCYEILCIGNDVTQLKKLEGERIRMQKLESLGVVVGGIAHDFNNLLTGIIGSASLSVMEDNVQERKALVGAIISAGQRAANLTRKLLAFAKGGIPEKKLGSVSEVIKEAVEFFLLGKTSLCQCQLELSENLWSAEADFGQISQVFQNLIINASQAMTDGGNIQIKGENLEVSTMNHYGLDAGLYAHIQVIDSGLGIPQCNLSRIYDPYFTTKETSDGGSGLGLAVAHTVMKNHKGLISVESVLGRGTTFHIFLPAVRQKTQELEECTCCESGEIRKLKILVMDDEVMIRKLLSQMVQCLGHDADLASHGEEALEKYKAVFQTEMSYDLVILDLRILNGMDGIETLQKLRAIDPSVKAVVSSGYSDVLPDNFIGTLGKPYSLKGLKDLLERIFKS